MSEFQLVRTAEELKLLDEGEMVAGYLYGMDNEREPGMDKSRAFWHGWRNARADRTGAVDEAQRSLARSVRAN